MCQAEFWYVNAEKLCILGFNNLLTPLLRSKQVSNRFNQELEEAEREYKCDAVKISLPVFNINDMEM